MQTGVSVSEGIISGTLAFIDGGLAESGPLAGDGNFLALAFDADWSDYTSVTVALVPSASGMSPVEILTDPDKNGVFKITSTDQILRVVAYSGTKISSRDYSLSGLTLEEE